MQKCSPFKGLNIIGEKVVLGFSGGPDAAALAYRLSREGAAVVPVYINYRKIANGGKTAKDLHHARTAAKLLRVYLPIELRAPLGTHPKRRRNRFLIKTLARFAKKHGAKVVALGTVKTIVESRKPSWRALTNDLNPEILSAHGQKNGVKVLTWDSFGVFRKADEFKNVPEEVRKALYATTSCQMWWKSECGNCGSCINRHSAFIEAFGYDPTLYRPKSKIGKSPETQITV